jgi:hypothetical protein
MVQFFDEIPDHVLPWLLEQHMFSVATAPLSEDGHVNVSPKGVEGTFHIIDKNTVWYEDLTGSGIETIAHVRENRRITVLFQAFEGPPRICRLFGKGTIHEFGTAEYDRLLPPEKRQPGSRAAIVVNVHKVSTSCGYAVPFYDFRCHRNLLNSQFTKREKEDQDFAAAAAEGSSGDSNQTGSGERISSAGIKMYWINKNSQSIDGLPGLKTAPESDAVPLKGGIKYPPDDIKRRSRPVTETKDRRGDMGTFGVALTAFSLGILITSVLVKVGRR